MFATRGHNENAIYENQTAAAAKPLNQGVKGLAPKTPGNKPSKTPFGKQKNDENASKITFGKGGAKGGKPEPSAFVTPANARNRAPLGNKTTNAKALPQSPAPAAAPQHKPSSVKATSPRLRRSKIKVHEANAEAAEDILQAGGEREIEYMPPRDEPLPDYPDDIWPHDREYPQLRGKNLTRGWWSEYAPKKEVKGDDEWSDYEEKCKKAEEKNKKEAERKKKPLTIRTTNANVMIKPAPSTLKAQDAASSLASRSVRPKVPSFAAPTAAAKARQPSTIAKKPASTVGNPRFTAAKAASNSTIGYSRGRQVSASTRRPLTDIHTQPPKPAASDIKRSDSSSIAELLGLGSLHIVEDDPNLFSDTEAADEDDEESVFQLDPVEDL